MEKVKVKEVLYNEDLHFEHQQWRSEIAFWEDELKSFKNRLSELVMRWTDKNVLAQLEHYQNEFIIHQEIIDTLQHDINLHETNMAELSIRDEDSIDTTFAKKHLEFRNRMEAQRQIYADLKSEFYKFLAKYM